MKADDATKLAHQALDNLAAALADGQSQALTAYLAALAHFHRYSFSNVMLIVMQRPDATHVAGFNTWKKLGRYVKKGEKGIVIIAPMLIQPKERDGAEQPVEDERKLLRFKAVYVFDVAQTDGEPLPELGRVGGNPNGGTERLKALITAKGVQLEYAEELYGALGVSQGGRIQVRTGLSPAEEFRVLVHELAHELLHKGERRSETSKTVRETEADAVAYVVCQAIGLETGTATSDYIQLYAGTADTLAESLDCIQKTAAEIIEAVAEDE